MKITVPIKGNLPPTIAKKRQVEIEVGNDLLGEALKKYAAPKKAKE